MEEFERIYGERADTYYATTQDEALEGADALAICTEWKSFRAVDPHMLRGALSSAVVVDGRNLFDPLTMAQAGVAYHAIGRPYITPGV